MPDPVDPGARRLRVAVVSPLPPDASGIADYMAELAPHLARHLAVELFTEGRHPEGTLAEIPVRPLRALPRLAGGYDAIVYQLGNNPDFHAETYRTLLELPGVVVLHETMLHHLVKALTLDRGDPAAFVEAMRYCCGRSGQAAARRFLATGLPLDVWSFPLFERAVDASRGVIVHNEHARRRVLASRPLARVARVPLPFDPGALPADPARERAAARAELGIPEGTLVVASFGFITPAKRLEVTLRAFRRLRREVPEALYLSVGEVSPYYDLESVLDRTGREGVLLAGRVGLDRFHRAMSAADVAVNLRHPTGGETSATLIRLLGMGTPAVVTNAGSFAEVPDDCCAKVDLDETEEELLAAYLLRLAKDEPLRRKMGANARRHVAEHHTLDGAARGYTAFLTEVVAAGAAPEPARPPLAPYPPDYVFTDLVAEVAGAVADLGVGEEDDDLLRGVAAVLVDLDLR